MRDGMEITDCGLPIEANQPEQMLKAQMTEDGIHLRRPTP